MTLCTYFPNSTYKIFYIINFLWFNKKVLSIRYFWKHTLAADSIGNDFSGISKSISFHGNARNEVGVNRFSS